MKCTINSCGTDFNKKYVGGASVLAEQKRSQISTAKNTEELYDIKGKKYYISKESELKIPTNLQFGDAVLFERGGLWRVGTDDSFIVPEGVIFGAYGEGEKPKFYGSINNFADDSIWLKKENIYSINLKNGNVGIIVFDEKAALGVKKWTLKEVTENYDFYYDDKLEILYLYYDGSLNDFNSIEIGQRGNILRLNSNSVVDNLCVKYIGAHGIVVTSGSHDFAITNCEVGFIGGSRQFEKVRFGNGIEIQLDAQRGIVKNNWVYQCYDAGITFQAWETARNEANFIDLDFSDNLVEFCVYGFEFFALDKNSGKKTTLKNITLCGNIFRFSGYSWSYEQRPDKWEHSHIRCGQNRFYHDTENFIFRENIFDCSRANILFWWWHDVERNYIQPNPHPGVSAMGNSYYQTQVSDKRCITYFQVEPSLAENKKELLNAVKKFDSNPKEVIWVDKLG